MKQSCTLPYLLVCALACATCLQAGGPLLLQTPTISKTHIAFAYAGQLWLAPREGGEARLLTSGTSAKSNPAFSPDGSMLAFTGNSGGDFNVYVMPGSGGIPRQLTHHPALDKVVGWSPDGTHILFRSSRNSYSFFDRLFTLSLEGGLPRELPFPTAEAGSFSSDGKRIAYVPVDNNGRMAFIAWKNYRGGRTSHISIANLSDLSTEQIPQQTWNDSNPMWIGHKLYFLSDRNGPVSLFAYDMRSKRTEPILASNGKDIKSASAGPGAIAYEQFGSLNIFDLASGKSSPVHVTISAELPGVQSYFKHVADEIVTGQLSPSGARAVLEAHGEIFTVPAQKGDIRNLTHTPGVMERDPAWSPDGQWIAYFSDESGEYQLLLQSSGGTGERRKIKLGDSPSFYYQPVWSPDSKKIAYTDKRLNLWYVDLAKEMSVKVDTDTYETPERTIDPVWSPDSRWIAYTKRLPSHLHAVFAYALEKTASLQLTDGLSDARFPAFDQNGQYLYFTASTDAGATAAWLDLSSMNRPVTRSTYLIVLRNGQPSPFAPESDEEKITPSKPDTPKAGENATVEIDFDGISQRILALPLPARNLSRLVAGRAGDLFLMEDTPIAGEDQQPQTLWRFNISSRGVEKVGDGISYFTISFDGKRILYGRGRACYIASASMRAGSPESPLNLDRMELLVDPRAEWRQEYNEVARIQRDFFYDPNLHGLNLRSVKEQYAPFLDNIASRGDLSYLLTEVLGELSAGHIIVRTPSDASSDRGKVGLLGADYVIEQGRYKIARVYSGENWNPMLRAPLTQPGSNVAAGEYVLAVNGRELRGDDEIYALFEGLADKSVVLKVGPDPGFKNARDVMVVPIADETGLRNRAWIEASRRKIDELSGGRVAYVYLPDTGPGGYNSFNRYFFAQVGREGAVIDERFNDGGSAPDYVIDHLRRPLQNYWMTREGHDFSTPSGAIFGPKVMVTNMYAGSGGDVLPWYFRAAKLGPLVGSRTSGALIGVYDTPRLMDGAVVNAPRLAFYSPGGAWEVENHGVSPDYEVEITPRDWISGRDPQLEKAVALVLDAIKKNPQPVAQRPAFPNYHPAHRPNEGVTAGSASSGGGNR